jgi:hypothetical protein
MHPLLKEYDRAFRELVDGPRWVTFDTNKGRRVGRLLFLSEQTSRYPRIALRNPDGGTKVIQRDWDLHRILFINGVDRLAQKRHEKARAAVIKHMKEQREKALENLKAQVQEGDGSMK